MGWLSDNSGSLLDAFVSIWGAEKQEDFQAKQSTTQYQRAMADMRAAGLNPMLASQLGGNSAMQGTRPASAFAQGMALSASAKASSEQAKLTKQQAEEHKLLLDMLKDYPFLKTAQWMKNVDPSTLAAALAFQSAMDKPNSGKAAESKAAKPPYKPPPPIGYEDDGRGGWKKKSEIDDLSRFRGKSKDQIKRMVQDEVKGMSFVERQRYINNLYRKLER